MTEVLQGIGIVPGIAIGKIKRYSQGMKDQLTSYQAATPAEEEAKYLAAVQQARKQISQLEHQLADRGQLKQAAIMEAHLLIIEDPQLVTVVKRKIGQGQPAPEAVKGAADEFAALFFEMEDEYFQSRAADILDIGQRIIRCILNVGGMDWGQHPIILIAQDIEPSVLVEIPDQIVQGLVLAEGSTTSHGMIIAKDKGMVTIVGIPGSEKISEGIIAVLDGTTGELRLGPGAAELAQVTQVIQSEKERQAQEKREALLPAVSLDGRRVQVAANIGRPEDMARALAVGGEGVGLFRTEFLFMGRDSGPSEEEQYLAYREVVQQCGEKGCVIRTMDAGGDKQITYLGHSPEENPFLGWRGIRISLSRTHLFLTQLKAILRAGAHGKTAIMLPMVISGAEIRQTKELLEQAAAELVAEGKLFARNIQLGIMIETPAAAVLAPQLAKECDFFSIGSNDLVQYLLAVDRNNSKVRGLYSHLHPAVIKVIADVVTAAHDQGIWVGLCGEMAGDRLVLPLLLAMGIDELSMGAGSIPQIKARIRQLDIGQAQQLLAKVTSREDPCQVAACLLKELG